MADENNMTKEEFFSNVKINKNSCWEWQRYLNKYGYGYISTEGKSWSIHRYAYYVTHGSIPSKKWVLHKCDNRKCINPDHLYLGDNAQNVKDRVQRNRGAIAERNASSKLTTKEVTKIKKMTGTLRSVSEKFGVAIATIDDIRRGRTWKHV